MRVVEFSPRAGVACSLALEKSQEKYIYLEILSMTSDLMPSIPHPGTSATTVSESQPRITVSRVVETQYDNSYHFRARIPQYIPSRFIVDTLKGAKSELFRAMHPEKDMSDATAGFEVPVKSAEPLTELQRGSSSVVISNTTWYAVRLRMMTNKKGDSVDVVVSPSIPATTPQNAEEAIRNAFVAIVEKLDNAALLAAMKRPAHRKLFDFRLAGLEGMAELRLQGKHP